ncbi:MAG: dioxygenase [Hyphomicrobiales bacterium]
MRNVTKTTLTDAVKNTFNCEDERTGYLLARLVDYIHDYAREVNLTHDEWRKAIELLTKAGEISDDERNEFVLFSDVLGLSSLVDAIGSPPGATESSVLGPFHILGAPDLAIGGDMKKDNDGDISIVSGIVSGTDGTPLEGAVLEIWQTADNGLYSNQDPDQDRYSFRARQVTGPDGRYCFTTVRPAPYSVPDDGPVGELLHATGRHPWRPSHLHFIVMADGHKSVVTELFPEDDPYLDEDAVFGVRESLILHYERHDDLADLPDGLEAASSITAPYYTVDFDFTLAKET